MKLWYTSPAESWEREALPIGNGNMGGMVFGGTETEQVQINEITLWAGGPNAGPDYNGGNKVGGRTYLPEIREKLFAGDYSGAMALSQNLLGNQIGYNGYQNLGSIYLDFRGQCRTDAPQDYRRELDMEGSVQHVRYTANGIRMGRDYFCSHPGNVMVMRLTADRGLSFRLRLEPDTTCANQGIPAMGNYPLLSKSFTIAAERDAIICLGEETSSLMKFAVELKVVAPGAKITVCPDGQSLDVESGGEVMILMSAGTNFDLSEGKNIRKIADFHTADGDYLDNRDPDGSAVLRRVRDRVAAAAGKSYDELLAIHQADYRNLYSRSDIRLGDGQEEDCPTDELLRRYRNGRKSRYLESLVFHYGKYLLISSSRDSLPANLQGLWNNSNNPPWEGDYHLDINLQMNYWPAFVTNLAETADPLINLVDSLRGPGSITAREVYGVEQGWAVGVQDNVFGLTGTNGCELAWCLLPACGAWICDNLWDNYRFTEDPAVLERVYPILKEAAQFWQGWLVEDPRTRKNGVPGTGELVTAPSLSPEQTNVTVGIGSSFDMQMAYMLFADVLSAAEAMSRLRGEPVDPEFCGDIAEKMTRINPILIGQSGQIKEFREETSCDSFPGSEREHRHLSHLMALHPGELITDDTPRWMDAAIVALRNRGQGGIGGWSAVVRSLLWARTGNARKAMDFLYRLVVGGGLYPNLFDQIGVFQIDGNLGYTAAVAEMLLQSHGGCLRPLAALPEEWERGAFRGLRARGNFETDAVWSGGQLETLTVRSGSGNRCVLRYPCIRGAKITCCGQDVKADTVDKNTVAFDTVPGAEYVVTEIPRVLAAPTSLTAERAGSDTVRLHWDAVPGARCYAVYRCVENGPRRRIAADVPDCEFIDQTAADGLCSYKAAAIDGEGAEGPDSAWAMEAHICTNS